MKTTTVLYFETLADLCRYIKAVHASAYRIDTSRLTVKLALTPFELALALEQYQASVAACQPEKI